MQAQAESAKEVLDRRKRRKEALQHLDADVQQAKQPLPDFQLANASQRKDLRTKIEDRLALLATAIATAQKVEIAVVQAKKVQAELQGQLSALDAGEQLKAVLVTKPIDASSLKVRHKTLQGAICVATWS